MNVFDKCHVKSWTVSVLLEISLLASKLVSGGESTLNLSLHPSFSCYRWLSCCPVQIKGLCADYVFLLSCNKIIHPETAGRPSQGHLKEVNDPVQDVFALLINTPLVDNKPLHWMEQFKKKKVKKYRCLQAGSYCWRVRQSSPPCCPRGKAECCHWLQPKPTALDNLFVNWTLILASSALRTLYPAADWVTSRTESLTCGITHRQC